MWNGTGYWGTPNYGQQRYGVPQFGGFNQQVPPMQQPVMNNQPVQPQQQPTVQGFAWVNGEAGAQAYLLPPNAGMVLFDSDNAGIFYMKTSDAAGKASLEPFKYEKLSSVRQEATSSNYVTREEFESFKASFSANKGEDTI